MTTPSTPGRPRDPTIDQAIRQAVLSLLAEGGRGAVTVDAVAERARTSRASIYRRYDDARDLLISVLIDALGGPPPDARPFVPPDHLAGQDLVRALIADAERAFAALDDAGVGPALFGAVAEDPDLAARLYDRYLGRMRALLAERIRDQAAAGELRADVDAALLLDVLAAIPHYLRYVLHRPLDDQALAGAVMVLWEGIRPRS